MLVYLRSYLITALQTSHPVLFASWWPFRGNICQRCWPRGEIFIKWRHVLTWKSHRMTWGKSTPWSGCLLNSMSLPAPLHDVIICSGIPERSQCNMDHAVAFVYVFLLRGFIQESHANMNKTPGLEISTSKSLDTVGYNTGYTMDGQMFYSQTEIPTLFSCTVLCLIIISNPVAGQASHLISTLVLQQ